MNCLRLIAAASILTGSALATEGQRPRALDQHLRVHPGMVKHVLLDGIDATKTRISARRDMGKGFAVLSQPKHGKLYGKPPELRYVPDRGYLGTDSFTFCLTEGERSDPATVHLRVMKWTAPIGIPAPAFGITQTHRMYEGNRYAFGDEPEPYPVGNDGPYTHYVDNRSPAATDKDNPFGTPEKPRRTIPLLLKAGSVVEVHGGPYVFDRKEWTLNGNGTREKPVFVRAVQGAGPVRLQAAGRGRFVVLTGSHFILENFLIHGLSPRPGNPIKVAKKESKKQEERSGKTEDEQNGKEEVSQPPHPTPIPLTRNPLKEGPGKTPSSVDAPVVPRASHHVVVRNCEVLKAAGVGVSARGSHAVVFNCYIHHIGNLTSPDDKHGMHAGATAKHIWFLDSHVHHCSGDGIQFCHGARAGGPQYVYVGRNTFHHNAENAIDIKYSRDVIISQNTCYGYRKISGKKVGSDGSAIVLGSDGGPQRVSVLFNRIFDSNRAIRNETTTDAWIIGNLIYDIKSDAFPLEKQGTNLRIVHNTVVGADCSVSQFWKPRFGLDVAGNLFANLRGRGRYKDHLHIGGQKVADKASFHQNLFWASGKSLVAKWVKKTPLTIKTTEELRKIPAFKGSVLADPLLEDPARLKFTPRPDSPAIDASGPHEAYAEFKKMYGIDIAVDFTGKPRPQGQAWDMGAFEAPAQP